MAQRAETARRKRKENMLYIIRDVDNANARETNTIPPKHHEYHPLLNFPTLPKAIAHSAEFPLPARMGNGTHEVGLSQLPQSAITRTEESRAQLHSLSLHLKMHLKLFKRSIPRMPKNERGAATSAMW
jgi:hypothetical protein